MIDCGAAALEWRDKFNDIGATKIYAFEPCLHNYIFLKEDVMPDEKRLILEHAAVGGREGDVPLYIIGDPHGTVYWGPSTCPDKDAKARTESVRMVKLSRYWEENIKEDVALLKMNIEGAEYDVFEDLLDAGIINRFGRIWYQDHGVRGAKIIPSCRDKGLRIYPRLRAEFRGELQFITGSPEPSTTFEVPEYLR